MSLDQVLPMSGFVKLLEFGGNTSVGVKRRLCWLAVVDYPLAREQLTYTQMVLQTRKGEVSSSITRNRSRTLFYKRLRMTLTNRQNW